jgi:ubiquinone/menaquinone biosynthesis C-methylase UbiE
MVRILRRFLKFFFYHFYHSLAWSYDLVAATVSLGRWNDWVLTTLKYIEGPQVLELGFGPGHLQAALQNRGWQVYGLDESRQMSRQAARRLSKSGSPLTLLRGYAQSLPFNEYFNSVVATFPSEYIADPHTLSEIRRVLVPGGKLVVLPMAWIGGRKPLERAAAWLFQVTGESARDMKSFEDHVKVPFINAGFEVRVELVEIRASTLLYVIARK